MLVSKTNVNKSFTNIEITEKGERERKKLREKYIFQKLHCITNLKVALSVCLFLIPSRVTNIAENYT